MLRLYIDTAIRASRSVVVDAVEDGFSDGSGISGQENYIFIRHDDGTVSTMLT